jgi:hypothetical protein
MMKTLSRFCLVLLLLAAVNTAVPLLVAPSPALAATPQELIQQGQCQKTSNTDCFQKVQDPAVNGDCSSTAPNLNCNIVTKYVNPLIKFIGILGGLAITIGIIVGGIQYASSGGDPQSAASGKRHIKQAVIALIGLLFLYAFIRFLMPAGTVG